MKKISFFILILFLAGIFTFSLKTNPILTNTSNNLFALVPTPYATLYSATNYSILESGASTSQASGNIEVLSPISNDKIKSSFVVKGNARTKDNIVFIRLLNSSGDILVETTTIANSPHSHSYGSFEKLITFDSADASGKLDVFQLDANNAYIKDVVTIPLIFN